MISRHDDQALKSLLAFCVVLGNQIPSDVLIFLEILSINAVLLHVLKSSVGYLVEIFNKIQVTFNRSIASIA